MPTTDAPSFSSFLDQKNGKQDTSQKAPSFGDFLKSRQPKWGAYAKPGSYVTKLQPQEEQQFQGWVKQNKIPWQDSPRSDYDMRGFWKAQQSGDKYAQRDPKSLHFPDTWKTPYHQTFSNESQYALPTAGHWEGDNFVPPGETPQQKRDRETATRPLTPWKDMSTTEKAKWTAATIADKPFELASGVLEGTHDLMAALSAKTTETGDQLFNKAQKHQIDVLNDPKATAEDKDKARKQLNFLNTDPRVRAAVKMQNIAAITNQASLTSLFDWEMYGTLFKPLQMAEAAAGTGKGARAAFYVVNQALGAKFSWDQFQSAKQHYEKGEYGQAASDMGGSLALLFMPFVSHVQAGKDVKTAKVEAAADLEELKKQAPAEGKSAPFSVSDIERAQAVLAGKVSLEDFAKQGPRAERVALDAQERTHDQKLLRENAESARQHRLAQQEMEYQEEQHNKKLALEQAKTEAERAQFRSELDQREQAHKEHLEQENARFQRQSPGAQPQALEPMPEPQKRPYQEPAQVIRGRQPLTRDEREQQRMDERAREVRDELAAEKQRRADIARMSLEGAREEQERKLREGESFRTIDRRGLEAPPEPGAATPAAEAQIPVPERLEPPPVDAAANIRQLEHHEAVATWSILENQKKLTQAQGRPAEEVEAVKREIEENKKLLADVQAERKQAETLMTGRKQPKAHKIGAQVEGIEGKEGILKTVTKDYRFRYRVVRASKLKPSHDPHTFEPTKSYPAGIQERDYASDRDAQVAVIQHAQNYDPSFTISDAPGPEHGPTVTLASGEAAGGNSRLMSIMRLEEEKLKLHHDTLIAKALQFGVDPESIKKVLAEDDKDPLVLVRELLNAPETIQDLRALGSDLNRVFTRKLSEYEQAVSAGKRISQETLDFVGEQLSGMGEGATLRDFLRDKSSLILEKLESDGVIASTERRALVDEKTGALNETGKDFVERALLGAVVDDPLVLANAPRGVLRKIERALGSLARIKSRGEPWDITDYLTETLREHITAASKGVGIDEHLNPPTMAMFPREPVHPIVEALAKKLESGSAEVKKAFESYAKDADADVKGQSGLGFYEPPQPWDSFNDAFKAKVRPDEWGTLRPHAEEEPVPANLPVPVETKELEQVPTSPRDQFRADLVKHFYRLDPEEIDAVLSLIDARAKAIGKSTDGWIKDKNLRVELQEEAKTSTEKKKIQAQVTFRENETIIRAFRKSQPSVASLAHEVAHIFRRDLSVAELAQAEKAFNVTDGWSIQKEENFARTFESYLADGYPPTEEVRGIFEKFKAWLTGIYTTLRKMGLGTVLPSGKKGTPLEIQVSESVRKLFDRMLSGVDTEPLEAPPSEPEPVVSPDFKSFVGKEPTAGRTLNIFRGAHGMVRVEFPDKNHADLFSLWGRLKRQITERGTRGVDLPGSGVAPDYKGVAARMGIPESEIGKTASRYRDYVMDAVKGLPEGETFKAEDYKNAQYKMEPPPGKVLSPTEAAKSMSDEDLQKSVAELDKKANAPFLRRENKARMQEYAKPFRDELARRGAAEAPKADKAVVFPKDQASAAKDRLLKRKPPVTLNYTEDEEETINDAAVYMGNLFENGHRDFESNAQQTMKDIGDWIKPYLPTAYNRMLVRGLSESRNRLEKIIPDDERRKLSGQMQLFENAQEKNRRIELPPGVEVRREKPTGSDVVRTKPDEGYGPEGRSEARSNAEGAGEPGSRGAQGTTGRSARPGGRDVRGPGLTEEPGRPLRVVAPPQLDVPFIPSEGPTVEPKQWVANLKAAGLPEDLPPPTVTLTPEIDRKLIFKGQPEIVQTALTSLDKYNSVVIATSTGTGKTYTGSAIIAEKKPQFGLILTPSGNISDVWAKTAIEFGIDVKPLPKDHVPTEPGVYVSTYATAGSRQGIDKYPWNLLMADESHFGRRWYAESKRGKFLKDIGNASDQVVYMSATPFHSALEMGYMDKLGLWKNTGIEKWLAREFNTRYDQESQKWVAPFQPKKLAALRQELVRRGMFVNLDRNMEGYGVNFSVSPLSGEQKQDVRNIVQAFRLAEEYFNRKNAKNMVMAVRGNAVTFMKSYLERTRLPEAIELGKKLEGQGWKVIYFTENKTEVPEIYEFLKPADKTFNGEISKLMPQLPGVVDKLKEAFGDDIANFTGPHGEGRQSELEAFTNGTKKHLVATYAAGGLGVSMHDTIGDAPRAAIYLGPPWSGVMFDQAVGRPWRFGTKSNVNAYILTSNAAPEMKLLFKKVVPRFESLKASVSGIHKDDPIVQRMKDLDSYLSYEFGEADKAHVDEFMSTLDTKAISTIKEAPITSAESAKNKGMQVERRMPLEPPESLNYRDELPPEDLGGTDPAKDARDAARAVRRPFVPNGTEKDIDDPRLLEFLEQENRDVLGIPGGDEKPPAPPDEVIGNQQIPPSGSSNTEEYDLANPKATRRFYEWANDRYKKFGMDDKDIVSIGKFERGLRAFASQFHTAPYVLRQFKMTEAIPRELNKAEMSYRRRVANTKYEFNKILGDYAKNATSDRRIYEALARSHDPLKELRGQSAEWVDHKPFTEDELRVAQAIRDRITEPIIDDVQKVRPDVGKRYRYAPLTRQIDELASTLFEGLNGRIPADLYKDFSLEVRQSLTKDPFSPHMLKRKNTPPKALRISEVMDAYIPSMTKVAEYTPISRKMSVVMSMLPRDTRLTAFAKRYVRNFFGVPNDYDVMLKSMNEFTRPIANAAYSAALDLNPGWFVLHSTKVPFNVWPELGSKYAFKGYAGMTTPEGRELVARSGVLMDTMWRQKKPETRVGKAFSTVLHSGMIVSDTIDRGVAYLGALEKAKDMGMLGDPSKVGKISWERLNQLAADGVHIEKALDYAYSAVARSNFMYTPANVQFFMKDHPIAGMFKSFAVRQTEFFGNLRKLSKEAKAQSMEPEQFAALKAAQGQYEYIDAVAKYRRILMSTTIAAAGAIGLSMAGIDQRVWPYHIASILSPPIVFASDTVKLLNKAFEGEATEKEWMNWLREGIGTFVPGAGYATREWRKETKKHSRAHEFELEPLPKL